MINFVKKSLILKKKIILASTSRYRAELLQRLQLPFTVVKPDVDETPLYGESPGVTALRLAVLKAKSVASELEGALTDTLIIGSDQVADLNGTQIGKPGTREQAFAQLKNMRAKTLIFQTALAVVDAKSSRVQSRIVPTTVLFRDFSDAEIHYYLDHENALDCAGSAKSEGLGAALMAQMNSDDPTALIGLPLLALVEMLSTEGVKILQ